MQLQHYQFKGGRCFCYDVYVIKRNYKKLSKINTLKIKDLDWIITKNGHRQRPACEIKRFVYFLCSYCSLFSAKLSLYYTMLHFTFLPYSIISAKVFSLFSSIFVHFIKSINFIPFEWLFPQFIKLNIKVLFTSWHSGA